MSKVVITLEADISDLKSYDPKNVDSATSNVALFLYDKLICENSIAQMTLRTFTKRTVPSPALSAIIGHVNDDQILGERLINNIAIKVTE